MDGRGLGLEADVGLQVVPERCEFLAVGLGSLGEERWSLNVPVECEQGRREVQEQSRQVMDVIGLDHTASPIARAGSEAKDTPGDDLKQDGGNLGRTVHGLHLTGKLRIESAVATNDPRVTKTST